MEAAAAIEHRRQEPRKQGFCRKRFILVVVAWEAAPGAATGRKKRKTSSK